MTLAKKYFERIPRGPKEPPDVVTLEVKQVAEKRMYAEADTNPQVDILWHTVPFGHRDSYALGNPGPDPLDAHGAALQGPGAGPASGHRVSTPPRCSQKWAGYFNAGGEAREGHKPEEVEQGIYDKIEKLKTEEVPAEELQKVKNNFAAAEYRRLTSNIPILMHLILNDGNGDWREINEAGPKIQAVTAADVKRVAKHYFTKENRTVAIYTRKAGSTPAGAPKTRSSEPMNNTWFASALVTAIVLAAAVGLSVPSNLSHRRRPTAPTRPRSPRRTSPRDSRPTGKTDVPAAGL